MTTSTGGKPVVLVVDDDPAIVNMLREYLEMFEYEVRCGYDGQMAVQMAHRDKPDLILMDVSMPMINGIKAFEFLRGHEDTKSIPVIFVSGELSRDIYPLIEEAPRAAHIKKPLDLENLNSLVSHFITEYPVVR